MKLMGPNSFSGYIGVKLWSAEFNNDNLEYEKQSLKTLEKTYISSVFQAGRAQVILF